MKILFLGYDENDTDLINFLKKRNHDVRWSNSKEIPLNGYDLIISFGYTHIIKKDLLKSLNRPIINLHISYLPFNRGAHPNFWSHYENTPSGVSIHEIDAGVDTGPILFQEKVKLNVNETLNFSYKKLKASLERLFKTNVEKIEKNSYKKIYSNKAGTFHKRQDLPTWVSWDMTIQDVYEKR